MIAAKPVDVNCAKKAHPALGVKRLTLSQLFSGNGCAIDHSEPHRLHFSVAIVITDGRWEHMVDFFPLPLQAGDLLLLRAGQVHAFANDRAVEGEILTFTPEFVGIFSNMPSVAETIHTLFDAGPRMRLSADSAASIRGWYNEFSGELGRRGQPYAEERIMHSLALLVNRIAGLEEFGASAALENPKPKLVRDFTALLAGNFLQRREPAWYAERLGVSTRTLDRRLVQSLKNTCKELITDRVILEAKRLLIDSDLQVKSVAHSLNFDEMANFTRFFRNNAGVTPREFRSHVPEWTV